jgi:hypothetical protein
VVETILLLPFCSISMLQICQIDSRVRRCMPTYVAVLTVTNFETVFQMLMFRCKLSWSPILYGKMVSPTNTMFLSIGSVKFWSPFSATSLGNLYCVLHIGVLIILFLCFVFFPCKKKQILDWLFIASFLLFFITAILADEMGLGKTVQVSNQVINLAWSKLTESWQYFLGWIVTAATCCLNYVI